MMLSLTKKIYESFPYTTRVKSGERLLSGFNKTLIKISGALLKKSHKLSDHPAVSYLELGNPKQETILILHGFGDVKEAYLQLAMKLKDKFHVIIPDMPGFGDSPRIEDFNYSALSMAEVLYQFIRDLKIKNIHLVGNSMGGSVAGQLAGKAPEKFSSLILVDSAGFHFAGVHSVIDEFLTDNNPFLIDNQLDYKQLIQRNFFKAPFIPKPIFEYLFERARQDKPWFKKIINDLTYGLDSFDDAHEKEIFLNQSAHQLRMPLFLVWGDHDSFFPIKTAFEIKKLLPSTELHVIKNCGHAPHYERPKQLGLIIKKIVSNTKS